MREALAAPGRRLDAATRALFEPGLGVDLGGVRLHDDARAARSADDLGALAYTVGSDVVFAGGHYAPGGRDGRLLLAHELTHVVQQRGGPAGAEPLVVQDARSAAEVEAQSVAERVTRGDRIDVTQRAPVGIARQSGDEPGMPTPGPTSVLWFDLNSDELRQDAEVDSLVHLALAQEQIQRHRDAAGDEQQILVHGYASVEGSEGSNLELSGRRAVKVKNLLVDAGIESRRIVVLAHGPDAALPGLEWNRRVEIELTPSVSVADFEQPTEVRATPCSCSGMAEEDFDAETFRLITSMAQDIRRVAAQRGIPPLAVAGSIAEEYDERRGINAVVNRTQDAVLDALWEWQIDVDRYFDIHNKLLNALQNDVGDANIKVRTALAIAEAGEVAVPGSSPSDVQVEHIIDYLREEKGAVEFSGAYIAHAQSLFAPFIADYDERFQEAVLVEYFNQGDTYYGRFLEARAKSPGHTPCPGDEGCVVLHNRARLEAALNAGSP